MKASDVSIVLENGNPKINLERIKERKVIAQMMQPLAPHHESECEYTLEVEVVWREGGTILSPDSGMHQCQRQALFRSNEHCGEVTSGRERLGPSAAGNSCVR